MNAKDINGMMLCKNSVSACGEIALLIRNLMASYINSYAVGMYCL